MLGDVALALPFGLELADLVRAVGPLAAAVLAMIQVLRARPGARSRLRADLELLELLKKAGDTKNLHLVRARVDRTVARLYREDPGNSWGLIALGLTIFAGFGVGTTVLLWDGFTFWAVLTGYGALFGLSLTLRSRLVRQWVLDPAQAAKKQAGTSDADDVVDTKPTRSRGFPPAPRRRRTGPSPTRPS